MGITSANRQYKTALKKGMRVFCTIKGCENRIFEVIRVDAQNFVHCDDKENGGTHWIKPTHLRPTIDCECGGSGSTIDDVGPRTCEWCNGNGFQVLTWEQYKRLKR